MKDYGEPGYFNFGARAGCVDGRGAQPWLFLKSALMKVLRLHKIPVGLRFRPICMAKQSETAAKKKAIELYDHKGKKRANNPPVGLVDCRSRPANMAAWR
jgi:hypothetical protein